MVDHPDARILIVDDEPANVDLLEKMLRRSGYSDVHSLTDSRHVLPSFLARRPDIVLLDLQMPHLDGFEVLKQITARLEDWAFLPVLVLTADATGGTKLRALASGATDFLTKPFDRVEVLLRIANLLRTQRLHTDLHAYSGGLEQMVQKRTDELERATVEMLDRLAIAAEFRDDETEEHTRRVGTTAAVIARLYGMGSDEVEFLRLAAPLHDIGKLGIPDQILLKPGKLTDAEFDVMRAHTTMGARILSGSRTPVLLMAEEIALTHHERWNGTGYAGLAGVAIPISARITAVADVFDALINARPYKQAWPVERALDEVRAQRGEHFDPDVVDAFFEGITSDELPIAATARHRLLVAS